MANQMELAQILQLGVALVGGGAAGAIITAFVTSYKSRLISIGRRIEVSPLFTSGFGGTHFSTSVTVSDGKTDFNFPNLHVAEVQIVNRGNRDLSSFKFGITLSETDKVVHVEPSARDRHHVVKLVGVCTPSSPSSLLDFELSPLNRGDSYTLRLFVIAGSDNIEVEISSSEPVRFTDMPTVSETLAVAARTVSLITLGGVELRVGR